MEGDGVQAAGPTRGWVLASEPVVVRFMNTLWADQKGIHDDLSRSTDVHDWLHEVGLLPSPDRPGSASSGHRARRLRDALRRVAAHVTDDRRTSPVSTGDALRGAIVEINATAAAHPLIPQLALRHGNLTRGDAPAGDGVATALAALASSAVELFTDPALPPLLACRAPGCVLYFVRDHPRREWCSPACGNRARAARHYQRHRTSTTKRR